MAARSPQDNLLQQILVEFKEMNSEIAGLRVEMENFKQTLEPITRIIRGDGIVQSLGTQIELLRQDLNNTKSTIVLSETKIKELENRADQSDQEDKKGKWAVLAAFITGILALTGAIIGLMVTLAK